MGVKYTDCPVCGNRTKEEKWVDHWADGCKDRKLCFMRFGLTTGF